MAPATRSPTEQPSTIAVVGASARAAVFSLLRAGYRVVAADLFADADLAKQCEVACVSPYPAGFSVFLAEAECDAWLYTGALENYPDLVDHLSVLRPLLGHVGESLRLVRDPLRLQYDLRLAGFNFPLTTSTSAPAATWTWLSKSYRGSCGSGVGRAGEHQFLQRRIQGISLSAVYSGKQLLGVTRQLVGEAWTGAGEFQYCGSIGPQSLPAEKTQYLEALGIALSATFALTGLYGVDLIDDGETLWVIEVNPRYTASMEVVERSLGISVFRPDQRSEPAPASEHFGKVVLYAKAPFTVTSELSENLLQHAGELPWPTIADIPTAGTEIETGQPVMTLFAEGRSGEDVAARLQESVEAMELQLYGRVFSCD